MERLKWKVVLALVVLDIRRVTGRRWRGWGGLRWRTWLMSWMAREEDGCGTALLFICSFCHSGVVRCNTLGKGIVEASAGSRYESPLQALHCVEPEGEERIFLPPEIRAEAWFAHQRPMAAWVPGVLRDSHHTLCFSIEGLWIIR